MPPAIRRLLVAALLVLPVRASPVPLTTCGQVIQDRRAELTGDLDCSAAPVGAAVTLARGGRLMLNGFTLTGPDPALGDTVRCYRSCRVDGVGTIRSGNVGVHGSDESNNEDERVRIEGDVIVADANVGARGALVRIRHAVLSTNGVGVLASRAIVRDAYVIDSDETGISAQVVRLTNAELLGNGRACAPACECVDLYTYGPPLIGPNTFCGSSTNANTCMTWGVCTAD